MSIPSWVQKELLFDTTWELMDMAELHRATHGTYGIKLGKLYSVQDQRELAKMAIRVTVVSLVTADRNTDGEGDEIV